MEKGLRIGVTKMPVSLVPSPPPQLSSLDLQYGASDDSCGGGLGIRLKLNTHSLKPMQSFCSGFCPAALEKKRVFLKSCNTKFEMKSLGLRLQVMSMSRLMGKILSQCDAGPLPLLRNGPSWIFWASLCSGLVTHFAK